MSRFSDHDLARITEYVAGEFPHDAHEAAAEWVAADADRLALAQALARVRERASTRMQREVAFDAEQLIAAIRPQLAGEGVATTLPASRTASLWGRYGRVAIAALVASVGVASYAYWMQGRSAGPEAWSYVTASTERTTFDVAPGVRMILAPESRARQWSDGGGVRVELEGQAAFHVTPDRDRPVVVVARQVETRVLGTEFDVRHYAQDGEVRVAVASGKVSVARPAGRPVVLTAGMLATIADSATTVVTGRDLRPQTSWVNGQLVFTDASVSTVLQALQRWYGYEFRLADTTLAQRQVTTAFATSDSARTFATLRALLGVALTVEGKVVTLHPPPPQSRSNPTSTPTFRAVRDVVTRPMKEIK